MGRKIGIIAGNGKLPILMTGEARRKDYDVYICGVQGEADETLASLAQKMKWVKLGQLKKLTTFFLENEVHEVVMAGKITKTNLFKGEVQPDLEMIKLIARTRDRKDDTLLGAIADSLESKGIKLLSSVTLLGHLLPHEGVLSKKKPGAKDFEEIEFGWKIAKEMARLDIGQTVITKDKAVMAIEAIEGTDEAILRGGALGSGEVNVIKVAKPNQDMRFDVPTIGLQTIDAMIRARARLLVFEARKTILLDQNELLAKANQHKIIMVAKSDE
ncbi:MAG: UDP-2,3-diacylglucosamine diphosphatase LpxI [Candidatus Omnitrophica bacterium]|nr:UDP-2,3-diacylglucosamine diphosphatase LpxI [Candidatus Omnitrophota bacterium]